MLLHPKRVEILGILRERGTCTELARQLGTSAQNANNHVKALLRAGFVRVVERRKKRNLTESVYQACSKASRNWAAFGLTSTPSRCSACRAKRR